MGNEENGKDIKEAMRKFGKIHGDGVVVCLDKKDAAELLGSHDTIKEDLAAIGISNDDVVVQDVVNKSGENLTCIATTVKNVTG